MDASRGTTRPTLRIMMGPKIYHPRSERALLSFMLVCAARRIRGQIRVHNSMLVHVTRYTDVQALVTSEVSRFATGVRERLRRGEGASPVTVREQLRRLWNEDFRPATEAMADPGHPRPFVE